LNHYYEILFQYVNYDISFFSLFKYLKLMDCLVKIVRRTLGVHFFGMNKSKLLLDLYAVGCVVIKINLDRELLIIWNWFQLKVIMI